ncbi:MAG: MBL fold metallo-hydrolase [Chlamydiota bacterium]
MKGFCPLASGSKGNVIFLGTENTRILIDAGCSGKQIETRLKEIDVSLQDIDAILITHEHADHINGLKVLAGRKKIPVLANRETLQGIYRNIGFLPPCKLFTTNEPFQFRDLKIFPFSIQHDTLDPVGFVIETDGLRLGFCTDLGFVTTLVTRSLSRCHYLYLESNHQPSMVYSSNRSTLYKQRVLSKQGHLSNEACGSLLSAVFHPDLRHVHLAHLSSECNTPEVALMVVKTILERNGQEVDISIAHQDKISKKILF